MNFSEIIWTEMQVSFQFKFCRLMNRAKAEGRSGLLKLYQTYHICLLIRLILFPFSVSYACKQTFVVSLQRVFFVAVLLLRSHFEAFSYRVLNHPFFHIGGPTSAYAGLPDEQKLHTVHPKSGNTQDSVSVKCSGGRTRGALPS